MNNKPKSLSVCTSIYNAGDKLLRFLDSISNQTYSEIELILVDDCSTDEETINILKDLENGKLEFKKPFKIIRNTENIGMFESFQKGLDNSSFEYVAFPESDDSLDYDFYENLMEGINYHDADVSRGLLLCINEKREHPYGDVPDDMDFHEFCIIPDRFVECYDAATNSLITTLSTDITYCWFYVFSKELLSTNADKPTFMNAFLFGSCDILFSQYKYFCVNPTKMSYYYYYTEINIGAPQCTKRQKAEYETFIRRNIDMYKFLIKSSEDKLSRIGEFFDDNADI